MSSAQSLREFIRERLTAAAAEIFSEFEQTIVRYEEEIDRQRRLLEISWKPQINLHRIELPLHDVRRDEEVQTDQQLWNKERTSSLDQEQPEPLQEGPEPPQMKVEQDESEPLQVLEQEELCMSQDEEQLVLKQETVTSLVTPADEDRDHHGPEPDRHQLLLSLLPEAEIRAVAPPGSTELPQHNVWEKEEVLTDQQLSNLETTSNLDQKEPEPPLIKEEQQELCFHQNEGQFILKQENVSFIVSTTHEEIENFEAEQSRNQSLCQSSTEAQNQDQDGSRNENSEPNGNKELTWNKRLPQTKDHRDNVDGQKLKRHKRAHLDKRRFSCKLCGKSFIYKSLTCHMRTHTGEKPYPCKTCGKCFSRSDNLTTHMRTHTGEKPYPCKTCGKCFSMGSHLTSHMKTHTGEKPYPCKTCGKCFSRRSHLTCHMKIHHR
ncbi:zinc finger and SCAN domain-containing protein 31 [Nothobranchius furzeri]|uniref:zinc finger and SCAN domain-containing protein 31 n=1 Tax=Nothobranchius furzeri TaxID=105023 RepID=UPI003904A25F